MLYQLYKKETEFFLIKEMKYFNNIKSRCSICVSDFICHGMEGQ